MNTIQQAYIRGFLKEAGTVPASVFALVRPALRALRNEGAIIERVKPVDSAALIKPWHANLPASPIGSHVDNNIIRVVKALPRTATMPHGANPGGALSTLAHEGGHFLHDKRFGIFQPRPMGRPLEQNSAVRAIETPIRELQANNTALQYLKQRNAPQSVFDWYKNSRAGSYGSHLNSAYARLQKSNPTSITDIIRSIWQKLISYKGYTPSYQTTKDVPEAFGQLFPK